MDGPEQPVAPLDHIGVEDQEWRRAGPGDVGIRGAPADAERRGHGRLVLVAERDRSAKVQEPGELEAIPIPGTASC